MPGRPARVSAASPQPNPADIRICWYGAFGDGRHHSLAACMRFRGLLLDPVPEHEEVLTGGKLWVRDFYIHEGALKTSYADYLLASFSPRSSPAIHLILDAPADAMGAAYFSRESEKLVQRLYAAYRAARMSANDRHALALRTAP